MTDGKPDGDKQHTNGADRDAERSGLDVEPKRQNADLAHQQDAMDAPAPEPAPEDEDARREPRDPREEAVRRFREMRRAAREAPPEAEPAAEGEDAPPPKKGAGTTDAPADDQQPAATDQDYELTVFGKTEKVSRDELIRRAQKASAADIRLRESNELIDRLNAELRAARERQAAQPQQSAPSSSAEQKPAPKKPEPVKLSDDEADRIARALQVGDEGDARKAIQELYERAASQAVDTLLTHGRGDQPPAGDGQQDQNTPTQPQEDVDQRIEARLARQREEDALQRDLNVIAGEFQEVWKDPGLTQLAYVETQRMRADDLIRSGVYTEESCRRLENAARVDTRWAEHLSMLHRNLEQRGLATNRLDLFRNAATAVMTRYRPPTQNGQEQVPQASAEEADGVKAEKVERKKAMPSQPRATAKRQEAPPEPSREDRRKAYVSSILKDRGSLVAREGDTRI